LLSSRVLTLLLETHPLLFLRAAATLDAVGPQRKNFFRYKHFCGYGFINAAGLGFAPLLGTSPVILLSPKCHEDDKKPKYLKRKF